MAAARRPVVGNRYRQCPQAIDVVRSEQFRTSCRYGAHKRLVFSGQRVGVERNLLSAFGEDRSQCRTQGKSQAITEDVQTTCLWRAAVARDEVGRKGSHR